MADNIAITAGSGTTIAADDIGAGVLAQRVKPVLGADGTGVDALGGAGVVGAGVQRMTLASDDPLVAAITGVGTTVTHSFTRPSNTTTYTVNDAMADVGAVAGGLPIANAARASGGSGVILDIVATSNVDPATSATPLQVEVWIFDQAVTSVADNAAFAMSDADILNLVAVVPLFFGSSQNGAGTNAWAQAVVNQGFTCVGSADLKYLVKVKSAYIPSSAQVFSFRFKIARST